jgi:hypothetical protein
MSTTQAAISESYQQSITATKGKLADLKKKIDRFSLVRLALLAVEVAAFIYFVSAANEFAQWLGAALLVLPIVVFIVVVKKQAKFNKEETYQKNLLWVYENEVKVINGESNGYDHGQAFESESHPYSADLDIFGEYSLFALTNRCTTKNGNELLAASLARPKPQQEIGARQSAIAEVAAQIGSTFELRANLKWHDPNKIDQIKQKLKHELAQQLQFVKKPLLRMYVRILPILIPVVIFFALVFGDPLWGVLSLIAIGNAAIVFFYMKKINLVYLGFSGSSTLLADYAVAIKWTEDHTWQSAYIKSLFETPAKVSDKIRLLGKIIEAFDARLNILLSAILNFGLLWDLKCCIRLEEWHQVSFTEVENGLDRIGSFEELISFATLSYNRPEWVYPTIKPGFALRATALGHPLIRESNRVNNGFNVLDQPTVDIITGSNMAGKSTFLRTVGINMVMAYAGGVVCAAQMELSIFKILTYMRIKDSLNESTSTFKAELNRLKMILAAVLQHSDSLVLIDEMLRGTNSRDKFLGSKVFIEKLAELKTPTLFATHDLQLSELELAQPQAVRNFHFDIQITGGEMKFDYLIKTGPCKTFNAAVLLKEIGLVIESGN